LYVFWFYPVYICMYLVHICMYMYVLYVMGHHTSYDLIKLLKHGLTLVIEGTEGKVM
jgi:hypothetical protein